MSEQFIGEYSALVFMAIALGMDAFSVSLGLGMQKLRKKRIAGIGITVGIFHILMPFAGIVLGKLISEQIGNFTVIAGGAILVAIGGQMIYSALNQKAEKMIRPIGFGLIIIAFTVSLDSFSVGLSLGMSDVQTAVALFLFGVTSTLLTWIGLLAGRKVHNYLGTYSEILGGCILCGFGLSILI